MDPYRLTELWRYPVKSLRGARCGSLPLGRRGPVGDREWMVVDADGVFLTQRRVSRMALVVTRLEDGRLRLAADGVDPIDVADPTHAAPRLRVRIWKDDCEAVAPDPAADAWLSDFLGLPCRLVRMPEDAVRRVDPDYALPRDQVGFADGFPLLLISQASLDHLNARLASPVPMVRFRPNLVVAGPTAHEEDAWRRIRIGDCTFRVAKPCSRCMVPTIDPATAQRSPEPLRTLMAYRQRDSKVFFGQNLLHDGPGHLEEGMTVEVLEAAPVL